MQKSSSWKLWLFFVLSLCVFLLVLNIFSSKTRSMFFNVTIPIQSFLWEKGSKLSNFLDGMYRGARYKEAYLPLQRQIELLQGKVAEFETIRKENELLKNALNFGTQTERNILGVHVIGKEISRDVIFIDKGSTDGVGKGMPVLTLSRVTAGEVIQVYENSSRVRLLSDSDFSLEASVLSKGTVGIIKGVGRFRAILDLIPKDASIREGDVVVTSHLSSVFPSDLVIGEIQEIEKNDTDTFQKAEIKLFFDIRNDSLLFVIL